MRVYLLAELLLLISSATLHGRGESQERKQINEPIAEALTQPLPKGEE